MEKWRETWRKGFARVLPTSGLIALRESLERDDPCVIQGSTTDPPPLMCAHNFRAVAACAVAYCGWKAEGIGTVGALDDYFGRRCFEADQQLGEPAACRWFLSFWDDTPRDEMRRQLIPEIDRELERRADVLVTSCVSDQTANGVQVAA